MNTDGTLTVLDAQRNNENFFSCIAMNEFGKDEGTLTLHVKSNFTIKENYV